MIKDNKNIKSIKSNFEATFDELDDIRAFVKDNAELFGFNEDDSYKISLAVDEACTNLIRYSFKLEPSHKIKIEISENRNEFIINIKDNGNSFNPLDVPAPDMEEYLQKFKRGGLGIHIMRSVMDEISYFPSKQNGRQNVLKLVKMLNSNI